MLYKLISFRYGLKEQSTKMVSKMNFIFVLSILIKYLLIYLLAISLIYAFNVIYYLILNNWLKAGMSRSWIFATYWLI